MLRLILFIIDSDSYYVTSLVRRTILLAAEYFYFELTILLFLVFKALLIVNFFKSALGSLVKLHIFQDENFTNARAKKATQKRTFKNIVSKNFLKKSLIKVVIFCQPVKSNVSCVKFLDNKIVFF